MASSIFVALEKVEACTAWAQQHGFTAFCHAVCFLHTLFNAVCVGNRQAILLEEVEQFAVVCSKEYESAALALYKKVKECHLEAELFDVVVQEDLLDPGFVRSLLD